MRTPLLATVALVLASTAARADDTHYQDYVLGGRGSGIGGAYAAIADDPSGIFYNPAGLVDSHKTTVDVETSLYGLELNFRRNNPPNLSELRQFSPADLEVIPSDAGAVYGFGTRSPQGAPLALGFDVAVPSYHSSSVHQTTGSATGDFASFQRTVLDRTLQAAIGGAYRLNPLWSFGLSAVSLIRTYTQAEEITFRSTDSFRNTTANVSFENVSLRAVAGAKLTWGTWLFGAALGTPTVKIQERGSVDLVEAYRGPNSGLDTKGGLVELSPGTSVGSETVEPLFLRAGVAHYKPRAWTVSAQATFHLPTTYERFVVNAPDDASAQLAARDLQIPSHVSRSAILDVNLGYDMLVYEHYSFAFGAFTDFSSAPALTTLPGSDQLAPGSSRLTNVNLYGVTVAGGFIGPNSLTRFGLTVSYGQGEDVVASQLVPDRNLVYERVLVGEVFGYAFISSTFRY